MSAVVVLYCYCVLCWCELFGYVCVVCCCCVLCVWLLCSVICVLLFMYVVLLGVYSGNVLCIQCVLL